MDGLYLDESKTKNANQVQLQTQWILIWWTIKVTLTITFVYGQPDHSKRNEE